MALKVLHLTYDMRIGGTEMVIKNIIEGADKELFDMSIFCIETPIGPWGKNLRAKGVKISTHERQPGFDRTLIKVLRRYLIAEKIDVVHCHQYTPWVYGALASIGLNIKVVFTEHGRFYPDSSNWKRKLVNPVLGWLTSHITAISKATREALHCFENLPKKRIKVIYNGIEPLAVSEKDIDELRRQLGIIPNRNVIGTVARFDPIKNHGMLLKAFAKVVEELPETVLLLVGDGEERSNTEQLIKELGLSEQVILPGYIENPKIYIGLMDVFVLSSLSEGTSMTLLEAMSLSKPCVVTHAGGNPEIIVHQHNGLVTKNDDENEFSQAVLSLLTRDNERMAQASLQRFSEMFSNDVMVNQYGKLYLGEKGA